MSNTATPPAPTERFQTRRSWRSTSNNKRRPRWKRPSVPVSFTSSGACRGSPAGRSGRTRRATACSRPPRSPWASSGLEEAKEEVHVHQQLRELYKTYGFVAHYGHHSFLIPLATAHLPTLEPQGRKLQEEIKAKMTAQQGRFDPDEAGWIANRIGLRSKALGTISDTAGGVLVQFPVLGELIDLQRNLEVFANAGAQEIALPPNGRIQFPKLSGGSTAYWVGEATAITESTPSTGNLDLQAKKLGVFVKINNELLRFASPSAEGLVRLDMARVAALKADLAMLEGTGGTQIKGLSTYSDITAHTAATTGNDGDTFQPEDVALMEGKLPDAVEAADRVGVPQELLLSADESPGRRGGVG